MRYLSLFSGAGGGDLAMQHLLGHKCMGYVEYDDYCQKVIKQRIADGVLDAAPIFGDIKRFIAKWPKRFHQKSYAAEYRGLVDVITGGFPCQPFSVAGKSRGESDERNMWPATRRAIGIIRPRHVFLENVPGLLVHRYVRRIFGDLAQMGYDARWGIVGADDVGAPHRRKRLWIMAYTNSPGSGA